MFRLLHRYLFELVHETVVVVNFNLILLVAKHISLNFFKIVISEYRKLLHLVDIQVSVLSNLSKNSGFKRCNFFIRLGERIKHNIQFEWERFACIEILLSQINELVFEI